jgi:hypothetical protein
MIGPKMKRTLGILVMLCLAVGMKAGAAEEPGFDPATYEEYSKTKKIFREERKILYPMPGRRGRAGKELRLGADARETRPSLPFLPAPEVAVTGRQATVELSVPGDAQAVLHYGFVLPDDEMGRPCYVAHRLGALVPDEAPRMRFLLDLSLLENINFDAGEFKKNRGGRVDYRIELVSRGRLHVCEGRFAYASGSRVPAIVDGPWVDLLTGDSVVLWFRTDLPTTAEGMVGERQVSTHERGTFHEFRLGGLEAGKTYRCQMTPSGGHPGKSFRFRTPGPREINFEFAFLSQSRSALGGSLGRGGVNVEVLGRLGAEVLRHGAEFAVFGGGMTAWGENPAVFRAGLRAFKRALEPVGCQLPIYEVAGGHMPGRRVRVPGRRTPVRADLSGEGSPESVFAAEFQNPGKHHPYPEDSKAPSYRENVYFFDYGNVRVVVLNTEYWLCTMPEKYGGNLPGYLLEKQFIWLQTVLNDALVSNRIDHVFVCGYAPAFPNGGAVFGGMWVNGGRETWGVGKGEDREYVVQRRNDFWKVLASHPKVVAAFFGGEPNYSRTLVDGSVDPAFERPVWQIVSGGAGAVLHARATFVPWADRVKRFTAQPHFCLICVRGMKVGLKVLSMDGNLIEKAKLR